MPVDFMNIKDSFTGLRLREVKHRFTYTKTCKRMAESRQRYDSCSTKKSDSIISREIAICKNYWRCYPLHYYRYNHYMAEQQLTDDQLRDFVPEFFFYTVFLPFFDSAKYSILLDDKILADTVFRSLQIPSPRTLAKVINGRLFSESHQQISVAEIVDTAAKLSCEKLFLKPANGEGGFGIIVFHMNESGEYHDINGTDIKDIFLQQATEPGSNNYLLQAGLKQHRTLSTLYPHSINTFRIVTEIKGGASRVVCSVLRIGCDGREVDNACQGGILVKLDSDTGKTGEYAIKETGLKYYQHPDTGIAFNNFIIPDWDVIKSFVLTNAKKLPQFTYLGWDIALTEDGPVAIEANLGFGLDLLQVPHGGLREAFGIHDPDFYWRNKAKRINRL